MGRKGKGLFSKNTGRYGELGHWGKKPGFSFGKFVTQTNGKLLILTLVILAFSGTFGALYLDPTNPMFHSYNSPSSPNCAPNRLAPGAPCNDPTTLIWHATAPNGNLGEFNTNNQSPAFSNIGTCQAAPDTGGGAASYDYSNNHKVFFQLGRWWMFYTNNTAGNAQGLNYVSFTGVSTGNGLQACTNRVEGQVPGSNLFTSTKTGGEYAVDANSTTVFVLFTPRTLVVSFTFGTLNANGFVTGWSAMKTIVTETNVPSAVVWDASLIWQSGQVYLFYNYLDGATNHIFSIEKYTVSTNSLLTTFAAIQTVFTGLSQDDIPLASVPLAGGAIYAVYGQFFQVNNTADTNFHGTLINGTTIGASDTINRPVAFATPASQNPGFEYIWQPAPGTVAGNFNWARIGNQTFLNDLWYATWTPGHSVTPVQVNPDPVINPIAGILNQFPYTACETFDSTFNELNVPVASTASPWTYFVNDVFKTNSTGNPAELFLNQTSPQVSLPKNWGVGNGADAGTGICTQYTNPLHQVLWGYLNGTNVSNLCNGVMGGGSPCPIIVGLTTLVPQPSLGSILNSVTYAANCSGASTAACIQLNSGPVAGRGTSIAITNSTVGDLSVVSSKTFAIHLTWQVTPNLINTANTGFGYFLTTNKTAALANLANHGPSGSYSPYYDPSVVFLQNIFCAASCGASPANFVSNSYSLKHSGDSIASEDNGGCPSGSPYICQTNNYSFGTNIVHDSVNYFNYSAQTSLLPCNIASSVLLGPGCSWNDNGPFNTVTSSFWVSTQTIPWFNFQSGSYYLGVFAQSGLGTTVQFNFDTGTNGDMSIFYYVPAPSCQTAPPSGTGNECPNTDTGGYFGTAIRFLGYAFPVFGVLAGLVSQAVGSSPGVSGALVSALAEVGQLMIQGLGLLEGALISSLNVVGNALGFGNAGTNLATLITQLVTFFTVEFPTVFANLPALFARFFDVLTVYFPWAPIAFGNAQKVLLLGVNSIGFIITVIGVPFQFVAPSYAWILTFLFFFYVMDDGVGGLAEYFESMQFLIFNLGLNFTFNVINYGLDIFTMILSLIPKPFIQMFAGKIPRLPLFDSTARFTFPRFDMASIRSGDLFGILLWIAGYDFWIRYNSAIPALPGSLPALNANTAPMMATMANFLPLTEIFLAVFFFAGLTFWGVMRGIMVLGVDAGFLEDIPVSIGLGQSRATGGHVTGIRTAKKHFQRKTPGGPALGGPMTGAPQLPVTIIVDRRTVTNQGGPINVTPQPKELPE